MNDSPFQGPLFVVLNAASGSEDADATREVIASALIECGREHEIAVVEDGSRLDESARSALEKARRRGGAVVAAGGDGTISAVAQVVLGSGVPFGVVPLGTFNLFARTHGIPEGTAEATQLLVTASVRPVQVGLVNQRVFLVNASLGQYPKLLEDRETSDERHGRSRFVAFAAGVGTLLRERGHLQLRLEHDEAMRVIRTPTLFVGNNRLQLEQLGIEAEEGLAEGRLTAISYRPAGPLVTLWLVLRAAAGHLGQARTVETFTFDRLAVQPIRPARSGRMKVGADGEVEEMDLPLVFRASPQRLLLLAPARAASPASGK